ncbi:unnamed protein product [Ambrosiozyma monospora]|uniref:Unnamed protein product n=1 Tax=Ambrosiozyma monospora TaxID=43982 RepID=A0ACB5SVJ4_AMBMO|nr:unnamed protein product [Ambrosiozyma monospora]
MLFPSLTRSLTLGLLATNLIVSAIPLENTDDDSCSLTTTTDAEETKTTSTDDVYSTTVAGSSSDDDDDSTLTDSTSTKSTKTKTKSKKLKKSKTTKIKKTKIKKTKGSKAISTVTTAIATSSSASFSASSTRASSPVASSSGLSTRAGTSGKVFGYASLNGGTTGGSLGSSVTVTTLKDLQYYCAQIGTWTIYISGEISGSGDTVTVSGDKSIIGKPGANLTNIGLFIKSVSNVIIQNLTISKVVGTDAIRVLKSHNVWLDHLDLSSDQYHGKDYYDGLIDITHGSDYITVSYVHFHDHEKTSLVGHSDSNAAEDSGHLTVTYAFNYWENLHSRGPSLRFGTAHIYNNYYRNMKDCINVRKGAKALVENNVFAGDTNKALYSVDGTGSAQASGNEFDGASSSNDSTSLSMDYPYSLIDASDVISYVESNVGAIL